MSKLVNIIAALVLIVLVGGVLWQNQRLGQVRSEAAALRVEVGQVPALEEEHDRLTKQWKEVPGLPAEELAELLKLRAQVSTTQRMARQNGQLQAEVDWHTKLTNDPQAQSEAMAQSWYEANFGPGRGSDERAKTQYAMRWGWAVLDYAKNHGGLFPASLREAAPFLDSYRYNDQPLSAEQKTQTIESADKFDLLYHGNLAEMTNSPLDGIIIIRQTQSVPTINGGWERFYVNGSGGGHHQFSADGNYDDYEKMRMPRSNGP